MAKPATEVKGLVESALRGHWAAFGRLLLKHECYTYRPKNTGISVSLHGATNLCGPWARVDSPHLGVWEVRLHPIHNAVKGQPYPVSPLLPFGTQQVSS